MTSHVIRLGNHYLQTDNHVTAVEWSSLCQASAHTKEWADQYTQRPENSNKRFEILSLEDALAMEANYGQQKIKSRWLFAFEARVRELYVGYTSDGIWTSAHMYYGQGLSVDEAAQKFGGNGGPTNVKLKVN